MPDVAESCATAPNSKSHCCVALAKAQLALAVVTPIAWRSGAGGPRNRHHALVHAKAFEERLGRLVKLKPVPDKAK